MSWPQFITRIQSNILHESLLRGAKSRLRFYTHTKNKEQYLHRCRRASNCIGNCPMFHLGLRSHHLIGSWPRLVSFGLILCKLLSEPWSRASKWHSSVILFLILF